MKLYGFDWDKGNWPKCGKHGVSRAEIEQALSNNPLVLKDRYPDGIEERFNAVGLNDEGRHLFVVFTLRETAKARLIRPVSARYMHEKEIRRYEQTKQS